MKKRIISFSIIFILIFLLLCTIRDGYMFDAVGVHIQNPFKGKVQIPELYTKADMNQNGIPDPIDIVQSARKEVTNRTTYKNNYYQGGYPPDSEGVCTDVIWRGLSGIGVQLKDEIDRHIAEHPSLYPRVNKNPDPNIDFRRVPNQTVYFEQNLVKRTTEIIPGNIENLQEWQPGDIVVYLEKFHHVAIVSDRRTQDGIPYIIHNTPPFASEVKITSLHAPIYGHYRWNFQRKN